MVRELFKIISIKTVYSCFNVLEQLFYSKFAE